MLEILMVVALQYQVAFSTLTPCRSVLRTVQQIVISCLLVLCTVTHPVLRHHLDHHFRFQTLWDQKRMRLHLRNTMQEFSWAREARLFSRSLREVSICIFIYLLLYSLKLIFAAYVSTRSSSKECGSSYDAR